MAEYPSKTYTSSYELERVKVICELLNSLNSLIKGDKVLDIGCNAGFFSKILLEKGYNCIGIDLEGRLVLEAKENLKDFKNGKFIVAELNNEFSHTYQESFDFVLCLEVIEHIDEPDLFLKRINQVLRKGGLLLLSTPNKLSLEGLVGKLWEYRSGDKWNAWDSTHRRIFSSFEIINSLKKEFRIIKIIGYYYMSGIIPVLRFPLKLPITKSSAFPLNRFGFNTLILAKKAQ